MYELVSYQMRPGGPAVWGDAFQAAVISHDAPGYGKLVGAFHSEFGHLNRGETDGRTKMIGWLMVKWFVTGVLVQVMSSVCVPAC